MVEAAAEAARVPAAAVRRALMLAGDLGSVAEAALADGEAGLARFRLTVLRPLEPMLAQSAADLGEAFARISPAGLEWKLDGARVQVHRLGREVRAFTRNLADITERVPELVEAARALPLEAAILDGEAIALDGAGRPRPFQETMSRFGSRVNVGEARAALPLSVFFFDLLHVDGEDFLDRSARERLAALEERLPGELRVPRVETDDLEEARGFLAGALERGHEGVMVKALDAPYEAGRRGSSWLKVKVAHTLDLVVLAAEWGHGRRRGKLSNLHLGARDPASGGFVMLGKTFKGLTDTMLAWQTERLLALETHSDPHTVYVRRSWWSRWPSTACRRARATPAGSRSASPASRATGPTSGPRRPTRSTPCVPCMRGGSNLAGTRTTRGRPEMAQYGRLRTTAAVLTLAGTLAAALAAAGTIVWAVEVEGSEATIRILLLGAAATLTLGSLPLALAQALRALADVGETVSAR
ncbi:MAG: hypothetical protein KatS3mg012_1809 [Gaiellaceae bacterium]|nr:MAG: hypothetical protein KatS3mg012_1809 [Gaiellaceae bacterium]